MRSRVRRVCIEHMESEEIQETDEGKMENRIAHE